AGTAQLAGNAAERISCASSRCVGSAWKPATSRQQLSPTTSSRTEAISPHSGSASFAACAPTATTGSTVLIARAHQSARMAPRATRAIRGTRAAHRGTKQVKQRIEASSMNIRPKMGFILRVYQMTESENAEDIEYDRELVRAGVMSARTY